MALYQKSIAVTQNVMAFNTARQNTWCSFTGSRQADEISVNGPWYFHLQK
ncbi:hypothetical Protein YC6258_04967 [Gynuella sunshinyii YC6258]|uniref:Uncharacterized protein n=1 Tax=Gynuella sunshinyii YC6258 TaxID=1445510 RepID=A0A0C5W2V4_9GAMM|nr:hypothetical Protein YC6258_04967 [Gynuella sunshinyii YC6258]